MTNTPFEPSASSTASRESLFGGDPQWNAHVPWLYGTLATPGTAEYIPEPPTAADDHMVAAAYWIPLLHLLKYSFGWQDPGRGLFWWYRNGKPSNDYRFELISQVWDREGQLDWFAAWLWSTEWFAATIEKSAADEAWIVQQQRLAESSGIPNPLTGGSDPLHLSQHCDGPTESTESNARLLRTGRSQRQVVFVIATMIGWYTALDTAAQALPNIGSRSWHVDVLVKPVGWLGTYRKSRATQRWFAGPHHLHIVGALTAPVDT